MKKKKKKLCIHFIQGIRQPKPSILGLAYNFHLQCVISFNMHLLIVLKGR